jgi:hypothetical protein
MRAAVVFLRNQTCGQEQNTGECDEGLPIYFHGSVVSETHRDLQQTRVESGLAFNPFVNELRHQIQRFFCFGQLEVIPEGVRQRFEDYELRIISGCDSHADALE